MAVLSDHSSAASDTNNWSVDCGIKWMISGDTLTIEPNSEAEHPGIMENYSVENPSPWSASCSDVKNIVIGNGVAIIGNYAFADDQNHSKYPKIESVSMSDTVTQIYAFAFYRLGNESLDIEIPRYVNIIDDNAFQYCTGIKNVVLYVQGNSLLIDDFAFANCGNIDSIIIEADPSNPNMIDQFTMGDSPFSGCVLNRVTFSSQLFNAGLPATPTSHFPYCFKTYNSNPVEFGSSTFNSLAGKSYKLQDYQGTPTFMEKEIFTIAAASAQSDYGTVVGSGEYFVDDQATLIAVPNVGYRFTQWLDGEKNPSRTFSVSSDATYTAQFEEIPQFTIVVQSSSTGGSVTGEGTYYEGSDVTITAQPITGYKFVKWDEDGSTQASRTISVSDDATFTAIFERIRPVISVIASLSEGGSVTGSGTFDYNAEVTINAIANDGYHFVKWDDGNTDASRTFKATEDMTYTAVFEADSNSSDGQKSFWDQPANIAGVCAIALLLVLIAGILIRNCT